MNIKAAAEKTGLTKKAIKYYESEGLINPLKNVENNYREYSDEDIIRLNLIGALRSLDIPIKGIKDVIAGKKGLQEALMDALEKIDENISYLEKSKLIISSLMEKNPDDYKYSGEQIKKLRETLELSRDNKKELISNSLLRIFPGNFGKMFAVMYEPFLEVKIDNDEKKKVWLKLVEFLDSAEEVDESDYPIEELKDLDDDKLDEFRTTIGNQVKKLLNYDDSIKNTTVNNQIEFVKSLKEDEEAKCSFIRCIELTKKYCKIIKPIQGEFEKYLAVLNENYKKYRENDTKMLLDIENGVKGNLGFGINDLVKSFNEESHMSIDREKA